MGGRESLFIGINMADKFGYVGAACPAPGLTPGSERWNPGQLTVNEVKYSESRGIPYLTFISAGAKEQYRMSIRTMKPHPLSRHRQTLTNWEIT